MADAKNDDYLSLRNAKDDDAKIKVVVERFQNSQNARADYESRWKKSYRLFRSYRNKAAYPYRSNIMIPMIFSIIMDQIPRMIEALFASEPLIRAIPLDDISAENAETVEQVLTKDFEAADVAAKTYSWLLSMLVYGTAVIKAPYKFEFDEDAQEITFDGPSMEVIPVWQFFPDDSANMDTPMRWAIHQVFYSDKDELETSSVFGAYKNLEDVSTLGELTNELRAEVLSSIGYASGTMIDNRKIEVLEMYDFKEKKLIAVANRMTLIREDADIFNHSRIIVTRNINDLESFWGIGEPEFQESMAHAMNARYNQMMDNASIANNQGIMYEKGVIMNPNAVISAPGQKLQLETGGIAKVAPIPFKDINFGESMRVIEDLKNNMRMGSEGTWELNRPSNKTATEAGMLHEKALGRIGLKLHTIKEDGFKPLAKTFHEQRLKLIGVGINIMVQDKDGSATGTPGKYYQKPITAESLAGSFRFVPLGSEVEASKALQAQKAQMRWEMFNNDPLTDQYELRRLTHEDLGDGKNIGKLLVKQQPMIPGAAQIAGPGSPMSPQGQGPSMMRQGPMYPNADEQMPGVGVG